MAVLCYLFKEMQCGDLKKKRFKNFISACEDLRSFSFGFFVHPPTPPRSMLINEEYSFRVTQISALK